MWLDKAQCNRRLVADAIIWFVGTFHCTPGTSSQHYPVFCVCFLFYFFIVHFHLFFAFSYCPDITALADWA